MKEYPDFEQIFRKKNKIYYSRTSTGIGHESIRLVRWLAVYDRSYHEKINYYDLKTGALSCLND